MTKQEIYYICGQQEYIVGGFGDTIRNSESKLSKLISRMEKEDFSGEDYADGYLSDDYEAEVSYEIYVEDGDIEITVYIDEYYAYRTYVGWQKDEGDLRQKFIDTFEEALDDCINYIINEVA